MVVSSSAGRIAAVIHELARFERSRAGSKCNGKPLRIPGVWLPECVLRTVLIASVPVVVMEIENRAGNDVDTPRHAPDTLVSGFRLTNDTLPGPRGAGGVL